MRKKARFLPGVLAVLLAAGLVLAFSLALAGCREEEGANAAPAPVSACGCG